ncbi:metal-sensitive transcriptional regulator [Gardnerella vaginalis]|uniref:metal-sensitive transcriptional regulator n=1 Tax=Gardnerella vaginalis TaxID=2702 RepID=UPI0039F02003|nr:metal-sensitive transcriptional regulator [Bifidobacterium sp. UMB1197]
MSDYNIDKEKMLVRLHRVCGQVHAVENMVEKGEDYNNILMQLSASTAALRAVALIVAHQEISKALDEAQNAADKRVTDKKVAELVDVVDHLMRYDKS